MAEPLRASNFPQDRRGSAVQATHMNRRDALFAATAALYCGGRRALALEDSIVRREVLKERTPALTIIITDIYDEAWLLEIEAIAAA